MTKKPERWKLIIRVTKDDAEFTMEPRSNPNGCPRLSLEHFREAEEGIVPILKPSSEFPPWGELYLVPEDPDADPHGYHIQGFFDATPAHQWMLTRRIDSRDVHSIAGSLEEIIWAVEDD